MCRRSTTTFRRLAWPKSPPSRCRLGQMVSSHGQWEASLRRLPRCGLQREYLDWLRGSRCHQATIRDYVVQDWAAFMAAHRQIAEREWLQQRGQRRKETRPCAWAARRSRAGCATYGWAAAWALKYGRSQHGSLASQRSGSAPPIAWLQSSSAVHRARRLPSARRRSKAIDRRAVDRARARSSPMYWSLGRENQ